MRATADKPILNLIEMEPEQSGVLLGINAGAGLVRRLDAMGVRLGQRVTKISRIPLRGPVVIQVGGTRVGLGHGMAKKILVAVEVPPPEGGSGTDGHHGR